MPFEIRTKDDLAAIPDGSDVEQELSIVTKRVSEIEARPISWLWPGRIARGKVSIIAGDPGLGKSQITANLAAIVTTGARWPADDRRSSVCDVLFLTAEDDASDTLRPRLEAAGADLNRVHVIEGVASRASGQKRMFSLQSDVKALSTKLAAMKTVGLVVIDPISAYLGGTDSHKNAGVRAALSPVSEMAANYNAAIVAVSHLSKAVGAKAMMRVSGSLAFVAAARSAWLVTTDPDDSTHRFFVPMKNNLGSDASGLAYRIESVNIPSPAGLVETSKVIWGSEPITRTADALMAADTEAKASAVDEAADWLSMVLSDGPVNAGAIRERATVEGIKNRTLRRASRRLGVITTKCEFQGGWVWSLPSKVANIVEDGHENKLAAFE